MMLNHSVITANLKSSVHLQKVLLTVFAVVLYRQVTPQRRTRFTKRAQILWSLTSPQTMAQFWNDKSSPIYKPTVFYFLLLLNTTIGIQFSYY